MQIDLIDSNNECRASNKLNYIKVLNDKHLKN